MIFSIDSFLCGDFFNSFFFSVLCRQLLLGFNVNNLQYFCVTVYAATAKSTTFSLDINCFFIFCGGKYLAGEKITSILIFNAFVLLLLPLWSFKYSANYILMGKYLPTKRV